MVLIRPLKIDWRHEMALPTYQEIMLPLLRLLSDGDLHITKDTVEQLAEEFRHSEDDLAERLASGGLAFPNRVHWARVHMSIAGLVEVPERGHYRITEEGQELLATGPETIDRKNLMRIPRYRDYQAKRRAARKARMAQPSVTDEGHEAEDLTPEEQLDQAFERIRDQLVTELLDKVKNGSAQFFEKLVVELLVAMGYGGSRKDAGRTIGRTGDEGIDGVIKEDRLGLDAIYVQAKRWTENTVSRPEIQKFAGALQGRQARKGVFITASTFSKGAVEFAERIETKIVLIDGPRLADLMIDHDVGVSPVAKYEIKRLDSDYFEEV